MSATSEIQPVDESSPVIDERPPFSRVFSWVVLGAAGGAWGGFLVGGITGRLAMFVLRLTSDDRLSGAETDDGFEIGVISGGTLFLMIFCAFLGAVTGLAYVAVRWVLPARWRIIIAALFGALTGGAMILHGDGIDFVVLKPLSLAVAMFIVVPALTTAAIAWLIERWRVWWWVNVKRTVIASAPLAFPFMLIGLGIALVTVVPIVAISVQNDRVRSAGQRFGQPLVRAALLVVASLSAWALANDITAIL